MGGRHKRKAHRGYVIPMNLAIIENSKAREMFELEEKKTLM